MENKTIREQLEAITKKQRLIICAPVIQMRMAGVTQAFISKDGLLTIIYEDGSKQSKHLGALLEKTELKLFEAVSHVQSKEG